MNEKVIDFAAKIDGILINNFQDEFEEQEFIISLLQKSLNRRKLLKTWEVENNA